MAHPRKRFALRKEDRMIHRVRYVDGPLRGKTTTVLWRPYGMVVKFEGRRLFYVPAGEPNYKTAGAYPKVDFVLKPTYPIHPALRTLRSAYYQLQHK